MGFRRAVIASDDRMRVRVRAFILIVAIPVALQGCAVEWTREHRLYCRTQEQTLIRETLYFGLSIPDGGEVSDADWKRFETDVLGQAFPKGFTVLDSHGAWRGADGKTVTEPGRIVVVVHAEDDGSESAIRDAIGRYRSMFQQEAVLRERGVVCVSF
jgi:uncharacterized protein DUF3574